jgi:hypothetical protein
VIIKDKTPYDVLKDDALMGELQWIVSQFLEKFTCRDSALPCHECRDKSRKLSVLFMSGFGIIGTALEEESDAIVLHLAANNTNATGVLTRAMVKLVLEKMHKQKWTIEKPWKQSATPHLAGEFSPIVEVLTKPVYKLAKRKREDV